MKWEYQFKYLLNDSHIAIGETIRDIDNHNAYILANLGLEGWELVSVDNGIAYFKRPIKPKSENELLYQIDNRSSLV